MCLAIPVKIEKINGNFAVVSLCGVSKIVAIELTPGVKIGDYVLLHAGFAIQKIDEHQAQQTLTALKQINGNITD